MKHLCDVNVWLALSLEDHASRPHCLSWYGTLQDADTLAFCRTTQQSYLRLLTTQAFTKNEVRSNRQALTAYQQLWESPHVDWLDEPSGLEDLWLKYADLSSVSPKIWMDAYLAAFAVLSKARLVTFDQGFKVYKNLDWINLNKS